MSRPARAAHARRLHARRAELTPRALLHHLTHDGDPLALASLTHAVWLAQALLVPPSLLHLRACERIAREFPRATRETPWARWLDRHVDGAAEELRRADPLDWRAVRTQPTPFEQSVASCFGVADGVVPRLIREFHALPLAERGALHALLPYTLYGLPAPQVRRNRRSERRAREAAKHGTAVLRQLLAVIRRAPH
jgi:hypothetical protein